MQAFSYRCVWSDARKQSRDNVAVNQDISINGTITCQSNSEVLSQKNWLNDFKFVIIWL